MSRTWNTTPYHVGQRRAIEAGELHEKHSFYCDCMGVKEKLHEVKKDSYLLLENDPMVREILKVLNGNPNLKVVVTYLEVPHITRLGSDSEISVFDSDNNWFRRMIDDGEDSRSFIENTWSYREYQARKMADPDNMKVVRIKTFSRNMIPVCAQSTWNIDNSFMIVEKHATNGKKWISRDSYYNGGNYHDYWTESEDNGFDGVHPNEIIKMHRSGGVDAVEDVM